MAIHSIQSPLLRGNGAMDPAAPAKTVPLPGSGLRDAPVAEVDQVQLTPESLRLRQQLETSGKKPPMDEEKIKALRAAIADGSYQVDSQRIAHKMLALETHLETALA